MSTTHPYEPQIGDRSLFPTLDIKAYLNHSAISPFSLPVQERLRAFADDYAKRGINAFFDWRAEIDALRDKLARLIGAAGPGDIALMPNTTAGVSAVAMCLPWQKGQKVVVFEGEFPTNVTPWQRAGALYDLEVVSLPVSDYAGAEGHAPGLERLEGVLKAGGVRLVAVSMVQFHTGLAMPVAQMAKLCHEHGAELFVDAIQGVGIVPTDVVRDGIDYLACGSHKWLMGPEGAGFLYAAPGLAAHFRPHLAGWLSHEEPFRFLVEGEGHLRYDRPIRPEVGFLEAGTVNAMGLCGLSASLDLLLALGSEAIFEHNGAYLQALEQALVARGFESLRASDAQGRSGILSVLPPQGVSAVMLWEELGKRSVSCSVPDGKLRFAPHWANALSEVEFVMGHVDELLAAARS